MPLAYLRLAACQVAIWAGFAAIPATTLVYESLTQRRMTLASAAGITTLATMAALTLGVVVLLFKILRTNRTLKANPHACLNCLYDLAPDQRICPECGRTQNREDLSPRWRDDLGTSQD